MTRAAALLAALVAGAASAAFAQGVEPSEFEASGIRVIHRPVAGNEVVAVRLYLDGGSANLTPETAGIERFLVTASIRGTEKYTRDEFAALSAATGTAVIADANPDYTMFGMQAVTAHWDTAWDLFTQAVLHPTFPADEVELVRAQIDNQLRARVDNPDAWLPVLANELMYRGHPYAVDPFGTPEAIEAIQIADLRRRHAERMTKENLLLVVVGNVERADLEARIAATFGTLPATGGAAGMIPPLATAGAALEVTERELPTNYVRGQFSAPHPGDSDYAAIRVAIDILSDRLGEEVRTKRNLSYAVFAALSQRRANYGLVYVTAVEPDTTLAVMLHEIERMKTEPIPAERLAENVNVFLTLYWLGQETNMGQAATLGTFELVGGGWENAAEFVRRVQAVAPEDIQRVARTYLKDIRFAVIGNPEGFDRARPTSR